MSMFIVFLIIRSLDILTTFLNMNEYGNYNQWFLLESNPFPRFLINHFGFWSFVVFNLLISCLAFYSIYRFLPKIASIIIKSFLILNFFIVLMNFFLFFYF